MIEPSAAGSKPYPRPTVTREPSFARKRILDTNILIDALSKSQLRHALVAPWFRRLLRNAPRGCVLIPHAVLDEFMHAMQNVPLGGGGAKSTAQEAITMLKRILRYPSVRVVPNANPQPGRLFSAVLRMRAAPQRRTTTDLRIAFTAVQHGAVLCSADVKDFGAICEALPRLKFYDPARLH